MKSHPSFPTLQNNPQKLLEVIDTFAYQHDFLINIGEHKGRILAALIAERKPRTVVECGGYVGYSTILFGAQLLRNSADADDAVGRPHIWSLEASPRFAAIATELVGLAGLSEIVTVVTGPAAESLRGLKQEKKVEGVDFLFLDHVEGLYVSDLKVCEELGLLREGGVVVADNVLVPGAPEYREYVRGHEGFKSWGVKGLIMPGEIEVSLVSRCCTALGFY